MNREEFFLKLFQHSEGAIELRALPSRHRIFVPLDSELSGVDRFCVQNAGDNLYFGLATRDSKGGGKENIVSIPAVWADVDYKETPKEILKGRMAQFPFRPSLAVFSGGGVHLYWLLREPADISDIDSVEDVNRRIAAVIGGDLNACDAARILRIPGTVNHKYHPEGRECRVIHDADFAYNLDDFLGVLPEALQGHTNTEQQKYKSSGSGWLAEAMQGVSKGGRNATAAKLAGFWINKLSKEETLLILKSWNQLNDPPLSDDEINSVFDSISRYEPAKKHTPKISMDHVYDASRMLSEYRRYLEQSEKARFLTGIGPIDKQIRGIAGGEVLTVIARAGSFKTAALQNMLLDYVKHSSWAAAFFSIEMPIPNVAERYLQMSTSLSGREVEECFRGLSNRVALEDIESQFINDLENLFTIPVKVSLSDITRYVQLIERECNVKIGVVGIDYLQLLDAPGVNEYETISRLARQTKDIAKLLNIPVVLLSQVSRKGGDGEVEITLDMGRGSGAIEEGSDFVLGLWQVPKNVADNNGEPEHDLICRILKNRKGARGSRWKLFIDPRYFWFSSEAEPYKPKGKTQERFE